jgi:predicted small secreted protein
MTNKTRHVAAAPHMSLPYLLVLTVIIVGAAALAACSTTEGFGTDVKHLGGDIEGSAAKNK